MAQCRIGVIGVGTFGINHLRCFRQLGYIGAAELVAAADINEELLEERAKEFSFKPYNDYNEMIEKEKLDGVTIVTPDPFHHDIVHATAPRGRAHAVREAAGCHRRGLPRDDRGRGQGRRAAAWWTSTSATTSTTSP